MAVGVPAVSLSCCVCHTVHNIKSCHLALHDGHDLCPDVVFVVFSLPCGEEIEAHLQYCVRVVVCSNQSSFGVTGPCFPDHSDVETMAD